MGTLRKSLEFLPFSLTLFTIMALPYGALADGARKAGVIEVVEGGKSIEIQRADGAVKGERGSEILMGDTIATSKETVYIRLNRFNELQITPNTTVVFEEVSEAQEASESGQRTVMILQKGIIWAIVANGFSVDSPFYVRTPSAALGLISANTVIEHAENGLTSVLVNEGKLKYARNMTDIMSTRRSRYLSTGTRVHITAEKIGDPKKFKRNLLISYLNLKASPTAKDMASRGQRVLASIAKKDHKTNSENEITWIVPVGQASGQGQPGGGTSGAPVDPPSQTSGFSSPSFSNSGFGGSTGGAGSGGAGTGVFSSGSY